MRRIGGIMVVCGLLAGCGAATTAPPPTPGVLEGVGTLPEPLTADAAALVPIGSIVPRPTVVRETELDEVAKRATGSRLLVIGDSILASTSRRYGGELCDTLLPLGWSVEVNAEVGRFIEFGGRVLDRRLQPDAGLDWDVATVSLGSNFGGDVEAYRAQLHRILDRLAPRPTVLLTVTDIRPDRAAVNDVIVDMQRFYPEVQVIDWAAITRADPSLLSGDDLHLSDAGRARLAAELAAVLGEATPTGEPECLPTVFTDDSAGRNGTSSAATPTTRPASVGRVTTTTTAPRPTTSTTTTTTSAPTTTAPATTTTTTTTAATTTTTTTTTTSPTTTSTTDATTTPEPVETTKP